MHQLGHVLDRGDLLSLFITLGSLQPTFDCALDIVKFLAAFIQLLVLHHLHEVFGEILAHLAFAVDHFILILFWFFINLDLRALTSLIGDS